MPNNNNIDVLRAAETYLIKINPAEIKIGLVFPNQYHVGMSNLGFQSIYAILNKQPNISCERFFLSIYNSLEYKTPLSKSHILAFSFSFELDFLNFITILKENNIPARSTLRNDKDPIIIAGGICTLINIEPIQDFIDIFVIGEAEESLIQLTTLLNKNKRYNKDEFLKDASQISGIFVPKYPTTQLRKNFIADLTQHDTHSSIITPFTEFKNKFLIEISRGCKYNCQFCAMGYVTPYRIRPLEQLINNLEKGLAYTNNIGLISSEVSSHPQINELCTYLKKRKAMISVSSLRANTLSETLLTYLRDSGQKTLTIAPEAGSQRLRDKIKKHLSEDEIIHAVYLAKKIGFNEIKLYFMYGLPEENLSDLEASIKLISKIATIMNKIKVSFNPFIPKNNTPFENFKMNTKKELKAKQRFFKKQLRSINNCVAIFENINDALLQGILAKGNNTLSSYLEKSTPQEIITQLQATYTETTHLF